MKIIIGLLVLCPFAILVLFIKTEHSGDTSGLSVLLGVICMFLWLLCCMAVRSWHATEITLKEVRQELKTANWLLRLSIFKDRTGVVKALDQKARELHQAFLDEASFQSLSTKERTEQQKAVAEAKKTVETAKQTFWELVEHAKLHGYQVSAKASYTDFILPEKKSAA